MISAVEGILPRCETESKKGSDPMPVLKMSDCIHPLVRIHERITIDRWVTVGLAHVRARLIPLSSKMRVKTCRPVGVLKKNI